MSSSMSGLRTIKRDFSESSLTSSQNVPVQMPANSQTASERRLKHIQDALNVKTAVKRPLGAANNVQLEEQPPMKKRQLPGQPEKMVISIKPKSGAGANAINSQTETPKPKRAKGPTHLSHEQTEILKLAQDGKSVFYTGSAGTGKSVLLRQIIKTLKKKEKSLDAVAVTASTGIAACNIGGTTIHSFAGIGIGQGTVDELCSKIKKNQKCTSRWLRTKVLIIDEVSMVDGDLFDKLSGIAKTMRKSSKPFGGIQLIVTGDFFQLPPVSRGTAKFAFEAEHWGESIQRTFNLTKVFRQRDQEFVDMLNEMRFGKLTDRSIAKFRTLSRPLDSTDGLVATELFPRREDVDRANSTRMQTLTGAISQKYRSMDGGTITDEMQRTKLLDNCMAPKEMTLAVGAQVMLIKNLDETLVNGSVGKIIKFMTTADAAREGLETIAAAAGTESKKGDAAKNPPKAQVGVSYPIVAFNVPEGIREQIITPEQWRVETPAGEIQASRLQVPLILAWAMSIHKSQGQTLEMVKVDLGRIFEKGQAYVALSRATSLAGLQVLNFRAEKVMAHPKVIQWSKTLETLDLDK